MTPLARYQADLAKPGFSPDPAQQRAVDHLQQLFERLVVARTTSERWRLARWLTIWRDSPPRVPVKGLYFWGGVGRGKTYLMDMFYDALPFDDKMRVHFHRFMQRIHAELRQFSGVKNPLPQIAAKLAEETRVVCFDEFFVVDIADAMILGSLLEHLFANGVTLVATSNIEPEGLYKDGLQRARFLPAIALLKQHTQVVNVDGGIDYRLRMLERAELFHSPLDAAAEQSLQCSLRALAPDVAHIEENVELRIEGRGIRARFVADDVAWFEFSALCDGPRSQNDYIELAREFHAILVGNVPQLGVDTDDQARRFINMVDEFYDRGVKLVLSAAVPIDRLYAGGKVAFEFQRTVSRLLEMQSCEYLAREHRG